VEEAAVMLMSILFPACVATSSSLPFQNDSQKKKKKKKMPRDLMAEYAVVSAVSSLEEDKITR
jgi:hypothetical protein